MTVMLCVLLCTQINEEEIGTIVDASLIAAPKSTKNKILKPQN